MSPRRHRLLASARGASLIDALIAILLVVTISGGAAHLLVWGRRAAWTAGARTTAVMLAAQKIEQLRALPWYVDAAGAPVADAQTDLSVEPLGTGGSGFALSPPGTLDANVPGYVDFLDADAGWRGNGTRPPPGAVFVRRWSVRPFHGDPAHTVVLSVLVMPVADAAGPPRAGRGARLATIRTRVSG
jgi:hypothetical protein